MAHTVNIAQTRLMREMKEVFRSDEAQRNTINLKSIDDNIFRLQGDIIGPPDTPYAGGRYILEINIPESYPFVPPKVKFATKVWHPNISSVTGAICLDILKDQWAAALTLRTVLLSVQALLGSPVPDDPQDAVVAGQYVQNHAVFLRTAKFWAHVYAGAEQGDSEYSRILSQLADMGFQRDRALQVLSNLAWNVSAAVDNLSSPY